MYNGRLGDADLRAFHGEMGASSGYSHRFLGPLVFVGPCMVGARPKITRPTL